MLCMHSTQMCCTPPCCKCQCSSMNSMAICAAKSKSWVAWLMPLRRTFACHYLLSPLGTVARFHFLKEWLPSYWVLLPTSQSFWVVTVRRSMVVQHPLFRSLTSHSSEFPCLRALSLAISISASLSDVFSSAFSELNMRIMASATALTCALLAAAPPPDEWLDMARWAGTPNCIHQLLTNCNRPFSIIQGGTELGAGHSVGWALPIIWNIIHAPSHLTCCKSDTWILRAAALHHSSQNSHPFSITSPVLVGGCIAMPRGTTSVHSCNHGLRWPRVSRGRQLKGRVEAGHSALVDTTTNRDALMWGPGTSKNCHGAWSKRRWHRDVIIGVLLAVDWICSYWNIVGHILGHGFGCISLHRHIHGCISPHWSSKPTKQCEHEGQDHHQTKNCSEDEKVPFYNPARVVPFDWSTIRSVLKFSLPHTSRGIAKSFTKVLVWHLENCFQRIYQVGSFFPP